MPNEADVNDGRIAVRIPLDLLARIKRLAGERKMTLTDFLMYILHKELDKIALTEEDIEWIKKEVKKNEERRKKGV
jgi:predicted DNA binding CopG/RHH family protein